MTRTRNEIIEAFIRQRRAMFASCKAYDTGEKWEALRLSVCVYNLVHDHGSIQSLLSQLDAKQKVPFVASGHEITDQIRKIANRFTPLIEFERYKDHPPGSRIPEFVPISTFLKNRGAQPNFRMLSFEDWWETDLIFFEDKQVLSRKRLVFTLRNQEGGGHFSNEMRDRDYLALRQDVIMFSPGMGVGSMKDLEFATMRQIAEEVRISLAIYEWREGIRRRSSGS